MNSDRRSPGFLLVAIIAICGARDVAFAQCIAPSWITTPNIRTASNCYYDVALNVGYIDGAGALIAGTGRSHPVTWAIYPSSVVVGAGFTLAPMQDGFSVRSWTTGTDYLFYSAQGVVRADGTVDCRHNLLFPAPVWEEFADAAVPEFGVRAAFDTVLSPDQLHVTVEVAARGRTFETSAVRNTLTIRNDGPAAVAIGARLAAQAENELPKVSAALVPPELPAEPFISGDSTWPTPGQQYVLFSDSPRPSVTRAPYFSAASLRGPWTLDPPPTPPDRFGTSADNLGPAATGIVHHCFGWEIPDPPVSRPGSAGIEWIGWLWGDTPDTARTLAPGEEVSFTVWFWAFIDNPVTCDARGPYGPVECTGASTAVALDATASHTAGSSALQYRWTADPTVSFDDPSSATPTATFPGPGTWPVTLDVGVGPFTKTCTTTVVVEDTLPPVITRPVPIVLRTSDLAGACSAVRTLAATAIDGCSDVVTITHVTIPDVGSGGAVATHAFGGGTTRVIFSATDASGNVATAETSVTIIDDTPPAFVGLAAEPPTLWPPNHRLVPVSVDLEAADTCDPAPSIELVGITSSEPEDFRGDGRTGPDTAFAHAGSDDRAFMLRAERDGRGEGRVYVIEYLARDADGNVGRATTTVSVRHDRRMR